MAEMRADLRLAANEAGGLLSSMAKTHKSHFSDDQQRLIGEICGALRNALENDPFRWRQMDDPALDVVKADGTRILVYVPFRTVPTSAKSKQILPPRSLFVHWVKAAAETTKAVTPGKQSLQLIEKHGGYWATDKRGIKPLRGAPSLWMPSPWLPGQ